MPDVQCTFESEDQEFCNWVPMANANGIMDVGSAVEGGPPFDHTLGNEAGHYTYLHTYDTTATARAKATKEYLETEHWGRKEDKEMTEQEKTTKEICKPKD